MMWVLSFPSPARGKVDRALSCARRMGWLRREKLGSERPILGIFQKKCVAPKMEGAIHLPHFVEKENRS
jgi:hypothetical protein